MTHKIPYNANSKTKVPYIYLDILNRISIFVENDKMGETFAITFLSYLGSRRMIANKERMVEIFLTLCTLSKHLSDPLYALKYFFKYF